MSNKANVKVHMEQGGRELVVESGGIISVRSGGAINVETGGAYEAAGADITSSVTGSNVAGVAAGYKIARGEATLDGSNPTSITTGLATVVGATVSIKKAGVLGDDPNSLTVDYGGSVPAGQLDVYAGKNATGSDPTQIASTDSATVLSWIAIGT